uniref:RBR-type E3 ubiquitin transferase n=1 Tax=Globodera pallida TaxID=36090 RepID=A0A183BJK9_GLOPA
MSSLDAASDSCPSEIGCEEFDYYATDDTSCDLGPAPGSILCDPEYVEYTCMNRAQVDTLVLDKAVSELIADIQQQQNVHCPQNHLQQQQQQANDSHRLQKQQQLIKPSLARLLLHLHGWNVERVRAGLLECGQRQFLVENHILADQQNAADQSASSTAQSSSFSASPPPTSSSIITRSKTAATTPKSAAASPSSPSSASVTTSSPGGECSVCFEPNSAASLLKLDCGHGFCRQCWLSHVETQLQNDFVLKLVALSGASAKKATALKAKYENSLFRDFVSTHPNLRICMGVGCEVIIYCKTTKAHRVCCAGCGFRFCFKCGKDYHAPANCEDCPNCHSCIEKNGGCNHMQCSKCKHHFCWMCFRDWKTHGSEYYECSRYKENPQIAQEANHIKARRALERYLHYYERFENHHKSLKMEEELRARIKAKIEDKVRAHEGTWIDWQYLHDAARLLTKCRYTLQYTYPFAYYMEPLAQKELFEYQQAQLEKEIEELSWKVERAENTGRAELENQMHVAELKRRTLLQDFFS